MVYFFKGVQEGVKVPKGIDGVDCHPIYVPDEELYGSTKLQGLS